MRSIKRILSIPVATFSVLAFSFLGAGIASAHWDHNYSSDWSNRNNYNNNNCGGHHNYGNHNYGDNNGYYTPSGYNGSYGHNYMMGNGMYFPNINYLNSSKTSYNFNYSVNESISYTTENVLAYQTSY